MTSDDVTAFAMKLRLTSAALGCSGIKELAARFRAVNPATHFDTTRAQKWFQGRALPRSAQLYDDWALVLGTARPGAWLAASTVEAFLAELCALYDADQEALRRRVEDLAQAAAHAGHARAPAGYLCGTYACYSLAWSPYYRGHYIRSTLEIEISGHARGGAFAATYSEALLGRMMEFRGNAAILGRTLHADVRHEESGSPLFLSLLLPGPPASVLCGVMSGATVVAPDPAPSATRIVTVRVPEEAEAASSNRYVEPRPGVFADDLAALGLSLAEAAEVDAMLRAFLQPAEEGCVMQVPPEEQARLAAALDKAYL